jgi:ABC-type sugar transport system substrate-binding protein
LNTTTTRRRPVRGLTAIGAAMAAMLALISAGCESDSFVPPPPEVKESAKPSVTAAPDGTGNAVASSVPAEAKPAGGGVRIVELILAQRGGSDRLYFDQFLRKELAKSLIPLRLRQPETDKPFTPEDLASAIRAAVGRGAAGLVVEPIEGSVVVDALYDAVDRGVAVLLLDRPVPTRGGKSIPRVEFTGFADVGRQLVAVVLEQDRKQKRAKPGRIVLLHHRSDDPYLEPSFKSLVEPSQAAGKPLEILEFDGDAEQGMAVLRKALEANPKIDILLADDAVGVYAGFRIHIEQTDAGSPAFLLAGYTSYDYRIITFLDRFCAFVDRSVESYGTKASQAIRGLMDAQPVGDVVRVPVTLQERSGPTTPAPKTPPPRERIGSAKR